MVIRFLKRCAFSGTLRPTIMTGVEVSKEYVRQQLHSMGVRELSEEDLDAYTRDFSRLIHEHLQQETPAETSTGESFVSTNSSQRRDSFKEQQLPSSHANHRHSALYKTFPGDKENRVYPLPVSATPSPLRVPAAHPTTTTATTVRHTSPADQLGEVSRERGTWDKGTTGKPATVRRKRKVLRKVNGESRVFDESYSTVAASPSVESVASDLSDLSLTSVTSSESGSPSGEGSVNHSTSHRTQQCKSFIRPSTSQLYSRRFKKHDPVNRYHYWKEVWQNEKFPGEDNRSALRWQIREQMMQQDLPLFVPPRRQVKINNYVVPTDKKRMALRWEVRHQMAQQ